MPTSSIVLFNNKPFINVDFPDDNTPIIGIVYFANPFIYIFLSNII